MSRGWRVIDLINFEGQIKTSRGQIVVDSNGLDRVSLPLADVAVVLVGANCSISSGALNYLGMQDAALLVCDWRGVPISGLYPWSAHTRVAARHFAQSNLTRPRAKNAWMQLIRSKIAGQAATLAQHDSAGAKYLTGLATQVKSGDPDNLEAAAARWYWARLFQDTSFKRDQDSLDSLNSMLNYGYGILRGFGIRAVTSAGLSSPLGVFHHNRSNFFNLVEDLIEPFRPAIDWVVASQKPTASLGDQAVKHALVAAATQEFTDDGLGIPAELDDLAQRYGRYVESEAGLFSVPTWKPPKSS